MKRHGGLVIRGDIDPNFSHPGLGVRAAKRIDDGEQKEEIKEIDITVLVEGIIKPYDKNSEGKLVKAITIPWAAIIEKLSINPKLMFEIPHEKWEEIVAATYDVAGFEEVVLTPRSHDFGRDVIATKYGLGTIRILNSVKAYREGKLVRYDDIRSLRGVLDGDLRASKAVLTTTSDFPKYIMNDPYIKDAIPKRLELINGSELVKWLSELANSKHFL